MNSPQIKTDSDEEIKKDQINKNKLMHESVINNYFKMQMRETMEGFRTPPQNIEAFKLHFTVQIMLSKIRRL